MRLETTLSPASTRETKASLQHHPWHSLSLRHGSHDRARISGSAQVRTNGGRWQRLSPVGPAPYHSLRYMEGTSQAQEYRGRRRAVWNRLKQQLLELRDAAACPRHGWHSVEVQIMVRNTVAPERIQAAGTTHPRYNRYKSADRPALERPKIAQQPSARPDTLATDYSQRATW